MLFLFLSILFLYDLLHYGQAKANGKDEFLDYSITEFWWDSAPGIDQMDRILPTPTRWLINNENSQISPKPQTPVEYLEKFYSFPNITLSSFPFDIEKHTVVTPMRPESWHEQHPGLTPPPNFPSNYKYSTVYPYTTLSPYIPSPTGPTPKGPSFTLPKVDRPPFPTSSTSSTPEYNWDQEDYLKNWEQRLYLSAGPVHSTTSVVTLDNEVFDNDNTGFQEALRQGSKRNQDENTQIKTSFFEYATQAGLIEEITIFDSRGARDAEIKDEALLYDINLKSGESATQENAESLTTPTIKFQKTDFLDMSTVKIDDNRDIYVDIKQTTARKNTVNVLRILAKPERSVMMLKEERKQSEQTVTTTPATVTEYLRQISVTQSYFDMIEALQEGYMLVFLIELTRLIATKEGKAVRDVIKHTDQIIYRSYQSGQLQWMGDSLIYVTTMVARLLKEMEIDIIQNHAAKLYHMLSQRHQVLSVEVNTILEYADTLYDDQEGRLLFDALKQFAVYPNISVTGYWVCNSLIHNFLRPYRRLKGTQQRQELLDSVNLSIKTRLSPDILNEESPLRNDDIERSIDPFDDTKLSTEKELWTQTEQTRKRKRHHRSYKRKRKRKQYTDTDLT